MSIEGLRKKIIEAFGDNTVVRGNCDGVSNLKRFSSGSLALDIDLGGGYPHGRFIEIFGPESCIDVNTFISYEVWTKDGKRQNHKGGTVERLYERFQGKDSHHLSNKDADYFVKSINEENRVILNKVADVVRCGDKPCIRITTAKGKSLIATKEHKFFTGQSYVEAGSLSIGDRVYIHNNTRFTGRKEQIRYKEVMVKYHPKANKKIVNGCTYYRLRNSVFIWEAVNNSLTPDEYRKILNSGNKKVISQLKFKPNGYDIHHINEDFSDDRYENLLLVDKSEHYRHHATKNHNNLRFMVVEDYIKSIEDVGIRPTYDIKCLVPYNNYIADGIVVHNSGKSYLAYNAMASITNSATNNKVALVDEERSFTAEWAEKCGVNTENVDVYRSKYAEHSVDMMEVIISSGDYALVILDSIDALQPKKIMDESSEKDTMGIRARLLNNFLRSANKGMAAVELMGKQTTLIMINQLRMKIGMVFGNPETTPGGNGPKFYSSIRIDTRKKDPLTDLDDVIHGQNTAYKIVKNKTAPPMRQGEISYYFDGEQAGKINNIRALTEFGVKFGFIHKGGAWYSGDWIGEQKVQGADGVTACLAQKPVAELNSMVEQIEAQIKYPIAFRFR